MPAVRCCHDSVSPAVRAISVVKRRCDCHAVLYVLVSVYIACVCVVCQSGRPLLDMFDIFGAVSTTTK